MYYCNKNFSKNIVAFDLDIPRQTDRRMDRHTDRRMGIRVTDGQTEYRWTSGL